MSSGIYSALSGALVRMNRMDTISDNLGNVSTPGFKKGQTVFQSVFDEMRAVRSGKGVNFSSLREGFSDFSQGRIVRTGLPLHVAINGEGFLRVRNDADEILYTRFGNMRMGNDGTLLTANGMQVLDEDGNPIVLPTPHVEIDEDGFIRNEGEEIARLAVFAFDDPGALIRRGGTLFAAPPDVEPFLAVNTQLLQGQQEESNINMMQQVAFMVESMRSFEACQGAIKTYSEMASKANEIGSLG